LTGIFENPKHLPKPKENLTKKNKIHFNNKEKNKGFGCPHHPIVLLMTLQLSLLPLPRLEAKSDYIRCQK
jgi:hypothetical protein